MAFGNLIEIVISKGFARGLFNGFSINLKGRFPIQGFDDVSIKFFLNKLGFEVLELKNWLFNRRNLLIYLIQLIYPMLRDILRKFRGKKTPLDNFMTSKDGMILIAKKFKDIN